MNWNGVGGEGFLDDLRVLPHHRIVMPAPRCSTRARRGAVRDLKLLAMAALGGYIVLRERLVSQSNPLHNALGIGRIY